MTAAADDCAVCIKFKDETDTDADSMRTAEKTFDMKFSEG